jgi:hypothetical protein
MFDIQLGAAGEVVMAGRLDVIDIARGTRAPGE